MPETLFGGPGRSYDDAPGLPAAFAPVPPPGPEAAPERAVIHADDLAAGPSDAEKAAAESAPPENHAEEAH